MKKFIAFFFINFIGFSQIENVKFYDLDAIDFSVIDNVKYRKNYKEIFNKERFFSNYFNVWNQKEHKLSKEEYYEFFDYDSSLESPCFSGNYNEISKKIIDEIKENVAFSRVEIENPEYGLTIRATSTRRLPTTEICFKKVRNAGESYPFDYFQYSSLWIGTPVRILTKTKDGLWYLVDSQNNKGWVKSDDVVILTTKQQENFKKMNFVTPIKDKTILKSKLKSYKIYIGTLLPLVNGTILVPTKNLNNKLVYDKIKPTKDFKKFPIAFTSSNLKNIFTELHRYKYTWGGLNYGRDCSSTLKDIFTPFGLWLPRNSKQQINVGEQIKLEGTDKEKLEIIHQKAVPFLSFLYKKGHIVLYVGNIENQDIIFQNVWGIKAYYKNANLLELSENRGKYGLFGFHKSEDKIQTRFNIGKAVFTNIEPSKNIDNEELITERFLTNFSLMNIIK